MFKPFSRMQVQSKSETVLSESILESNAALLEY